LKAFSFNKDKYFLALNLFFLPLLLVIFDLINFILFSCFLTFNLLKVIKEKILLCAKENLVSKLCEILLKFIQKCKSELGFFLKKENPKKAGKHLFNLALLSKLRKIFLVKINSKFLSKRRVNLLFFFFENKRAPHINS
jgi:hypothetical protein